VRPRETRGRRRFGLAFAAAVAFALALALAARAAWAQKVYLNPSDQTSNPVAGGGNEAQYALINAKKAEAILDAAGFDARVDQDFYNAPSNANSWGADIFVSIHTNAGGGHGIETLYKSNGGKTLSGAVQNGLLSKLPYQDRGLKYRDNLHVLNATNMFACLTEALFHDCSTGSGVQGHPPSESDFLKSGPGQDAIAAGIAAGVCAYYSKSCGVSPPQKGWFKGVVFRDPDQNDRIEGAQVKLNTGQTATTPANGAFAFELDPGSYTATATKAGFEPGSSTRTVEVGNEVWGSIGLKPVATPDAGPGDAGQADSAVADARDAATPDTGRDARDSAGGWGGSDAGAGADAGTWTQGVAAPADAESGCGCDLVGRQGSGWAGVMPALALLVLRSRRRTRGDDASG
jgi:N-acetylmuramoyl-L-alanine amidase